MIRILGWLSVISCLTISAAAAEPHRQHAPHLHGHGALAVAIDGKQMVIQLTAPARDIVGFEHAAHTQEQREAVQRTRALLASPGELFQLSAEAECQFRDHSILIGNDTDQMAGHAEHPDGHEDADHEEHSDADHDAHEDEDHAAHDDHEKRSDADHDAHEEHNAHEDHEAEGDMHHDSEEAVHSEVEAEYHLICEKPAALREISFPYFARLPNAEELTITMIGPMGQISGEVSRDTPLFTLP